MIQMVMIIATLALTVLVVFIGVAAFTAASANTVQAVGKIYKDRFNSRVVSVAFFLLEAFAPGLAFL